MLEALVVSSIVSWLLIVILSIVVYALARQVGVLHERIRPVGALSLGKAIAAGVEAPQLSLPSISGGEAIVGGVRGDGKSTLLFFLSSSCPVCKTLLPILRDLEQKEPWLRLVFASDGEESDHRQFIGQHQLQRFDYILSTELGMAYQISKLPYGVLIDGKGVISAHGLINNREHLESLFEAKERGVSSVQEYEPASA